MKTASYYSYFGPGRIVISVGNPRGIPGGYKMFKALAPRRDMLDMIYAEYRHIYFRDILGKLDPRQTWIDLHQLHGPSIEPVIQCFERPPLTKSNWCHRSMVAEYFYEHLGEVVEEIQPQPRPSELIAKPRTLL